MTAVFVLVLAAATIGVIVGVGIEMWADGRYEQMLKDAETQMRLDVDRALRNAHDDGGRGYQS